MVWGDMHQNIFIIVYFVLLVTGSFIRRSYTKHYKYYRIRLDRKTNLDSFLMALPAFGLIILPLIYALTPWLDFADYSLPAWTGWLGVVIFITAIWLLWRSHVDLRLNWSPSVQIREEQNLITHGVFRYIRHPMYAAHWLWGFAQILLLQNWIAGFSLLVTFLPGYFVRIRQEEKLMLDFFDEEYASYMNGTGRIIPKLWN